LGNLQQKNNNHEDGRDGGKIDRNLVGVQPLTRSKPHPVGMKARMHTKMSRTVMPGIATKITTMDVNVINMRPLINRNTSWNSALNLLLPTDTVWKRVPQ
jgi:hypothetical protein